MIRWVLSLKYVRNIRFHTAAKKIIRTVLLTLKIRFSFSETTLQVPVPYFFMQAA